MFVLQLQLMVRDYFKERVFLVALVLILFVMGVIFGVLGSGALEPGQKTDLLNYVDQGLHGKDFLPNNVYVRQVIASNIQTIFFLFFMGISVIGVPLALLLVFTRGFILGFSIGFLFQNMGTKGAVLSLVGIIPHNLVLLPGLFLMVVAIIDFAAVLTKMRFSNRRVQMTEELVRCALLTIFVLVMMVAAGVVQGYITPQFTAWLSRVI